MTTMTVMPRESLDWTVEDLDRLPDDGLRYELLDGTLLVSPAPSRVHQRAAFKLGVLLHLACPAGLEVVAAPLDWRPDIRTSLQPDVLVLADRSLDTTAEDSMILAVEVLAYELRDGRYVTVGKAAGDTPLTLERPFPVTIVPAELIR